MIELRGEKRGDIEFERRWFGSAGGNGFFCRLLMLGSARHIARLEDAEPPHRRDRVNLGESSRAEACISCPPSDSPYQIGGVSRVDRIGEPGRNLADKAAYTG